MSASRVPRAAWLRCLVSFSLLVMCWPLVTQAGSQQTSGNVAVDESPPPTPDPTRISFQPRGPSRPATAPAARHLDLPEPVADSSAPKTDNLSAVITKADYKITVEKTSARIACRFDVQVLRGPWAEIPIHFGESAVGTLKSDKEDAAFLKGIGNGRFVLTLKGEGRHEIQIELLAKIETTAMNAVMSFAAPPAGITTFEAIVPGDQRKLTVSPALVPDATVKQTPGRTRVKGHLTAASNITLAWRQQQLPQPAGKTTVSAEHLTKLRLRDDTLFAETRLTFRPNRGELSELKFVAPLESRILDVAATAGLIGNWTVDKQKSQQLITVSLVKPVAKSVVINIHSQRPLKEGETKLSGLSADGTPHGVHAAGVARETGLLIITPDARWDITVPTVDGWIPLDLSEIPENDRPAGGTALRFFRTNTPLTAGITAVTSRITVVQNSQFAIQPTQLALQSQLQYRVERIGVLALEIRLPTGLTVDRVTADHLQKHHVDTTKEQPVLRLTFDRRLIGPIAVTIRGRREITPSSKRVDYELPTLEPLNVNTETGDVHVAAAASLAVSFDPAKTVGVTTAPLTADATTTSGLQAVAAWSYSARPIRITASVTPRKPRLTGTVATVVAVRESGIAITTTLNYRIEHAPQTRFRFSVPAAVAETVRVTDAAGQPVSVRRLVATETPKAGKPKAEDKEEAAWVTLEVESPQPVVGNFTLLVHNDVALPELAANADAGNVASLRIEPVRMLGLPAGDNATELPLTELLGELSIQRAAALKVNGTIHGADAEAIDVRELQSLPVADGEHYRYHHQPVSLSLGIQKLEIERVAGTVVSRGLVEILLGQESSATYRCRYYLLSSERQRLRLDLPKSCEPLAVSVNGRSVALERNPSAKTDESWASFLFDISRAASSDTPFTVTVQYRLPVTPEPFQWAMGRVQLHLPKLLDTEGTPAVVQALRTAVWVPNRYALVGTTDRFTRRSETRLTGFGPGHVSAETNTDELERWIGVAPTGVLTFPTEGHSYRFDTFGSADSLELKYADIPFATWGLGLPLLLIGFILAKTTWQNRLSLVLLLTFATLFAAVRWSNEVYHGLLAARYGLLAVAVWWIVHGLFFKRPQTAESPAGPQPERLQPVEHIMLPVGQLAAVVVPPPGLFDTRRHLS